MKTKMTNSFDCTLLLLSLFKILCAANSGYFPSLRLQARETTIITPLIYAFMTLFWIDLDCKDGFSGVMEVQMSGWQGSWLSKVSSILAGSSALPGCLLCIVKYLSKEIVFTFCVSFSHGFFVPPRLEKRFQQLKYPFDTSWSVSHLWIVSKTAWSSKRIPELDRRYKLSIRAFYYDCCCELYAVGTTYSG